MSVTAVLSHVAGRAQAVCEGQQLSVASFTSLGKGMVNV